MREELAATIATLAALEVWPPDRLDNIMNRAMRGPLADLLPNVCHFRERLAIARDEAAARVAASARAWRYDPAKR